MKILEGKPIVDLKTIDLKERVARLGKTPILTIVQVGSLFESNKYIQNKIKKAVEIGIKVIYEKFDEHIEQKELEKKVIEAQKKSDGVIIQLPLPKHIDKQKILNLVPLDKDVDGLSEANMENFYNNKKPYFIPATARAIEVMLKFYNIDLKNKLIIVVGESNLVGRPIKHLLSKYTHNISSRNKELGIVDTEIADILIVAAGSPNLIKYDNVQEGAVVIDAGINTIDNRTIVGDVDFYDVYLKAGAISPSPGGIGPITVVELMENLVESIERRNEQK